MLYLVEANFSSYDTYHQQIIGIFGDKSLADETKIKWETFFKLKRSEIFGKYDEPEYRDSDGDVKEEFENEYYSRQTTFSNICNFQDITIREFELDVTVLPNYNNYKEYTDMINQWNTEWERDNKLNKILK